MSNLFTELKRRNVFRVAGVYAVVGWLLMQLSTQLEGSLNLPSWFDTFVTVIVLLGFPVSTVLAWAFELTPEGVKPTSGRQETENENRKLNILDVAILGALLALVSVSFLDVGGTKEADGKAGSEEVQSSVITVTPAGLPRIAVKTIQTDNDAGLTGFAHALEDEITNGLARFSYFDVAVMSATGELENVNYVLDSALRRSGSTLRLTTRLTDIKNGSQVWGETYNRTFKADQALELQDDLTDHVVASIADPYGALMRDLSNGVAQKSPQNMTAQEAVLRHFIYRQRLSPEDHLITRNALEQAVKSEADRADIWSALAAVYIEEYKHGYNIKANSRDRALEAARRAVELAPNNANAHFHLAEVHYFRRELGAFRAAAERSISLNGRDSDSMAMIGILMGYAGDWDRSVELTTRAMTLNPNHPGWYRFSLFFNQYRQGQYKQALETAERIGLPGYFADPYVRLISHAALGNGPQMQAARVEFEKVWAAPTTTFKEKHLDIWIFNQSELVDQIVDGFKKAGVQVESVEQ